MDAMPTHLFDKATAFFLAAQNTAGDGEWLYKAEPLQGDAANLYIVAIYDENNKKIGYL